MEEGGIMSLRYPIIVSRLNAPDVYLKLAFCGSGIYWTFAVCSSLLKFVFVPIKTSCYTRAHNKGVTCLHVQMTRKPFVASLLTNTRTERNHCVLFSSTFRARRLVQHVALKVLFFPARECLPRGTNKFKLLSEEFPSLTRR